MIKRYKLIPEPNESLTDMFIGIAALGYLLTLIALIGAGIWFLVRAFQGIDTGYISIACFVAAGIMLSILILAEVSVRNRG